MASGSVTGDHLHFRRSVRPGRLRARYRSAAPQAGARPARSPLRSTCPGMPPPPLDPAGSRRVSLPRSSAEVQHDDPVRDRHDQLHVVLDEQNADPALCVDRLMSSADRASPPGWCPPPVRPKEQPGGTECPGDLKSSLVAVGQRAWQVVCRRPGPTTRAARRRTSPSRSSCVSRGMGSIAENGPAFCLDSSPDLDVLERGQCLNSRMFWNVRAMPSRLLRTYLAADDTHRAPPAAPTKVILPSCGE